MTAKKRDTLDEIMDEYSRLTNIFIDDFWGQAYERKDLTKEVTNKPDAWLSARVRQCAAREALGMVDGAREAALTQGEEPIKPIHTGQKMTLSAQCVKIEDEVNSFDLWMTLSSIGHGLNINIPLKKHRHMNFFADWQRSSTVVIHRQYVQFSFEIETGPKVEQGKLIGLDVGINHLLATSEGDLFGSKVKDLINIIKRKQQGSKAYIRAKKTLSYYLHKQVKDFFQAKSALRLVVVERLKELKKGQQPGRGKAFRKTLSNWNYGELLKIIQMRAEENRVFFRSVNPYKTSQQCPHCSHTERGNRSGEKFCCLRCGYSDQADLVGAQNILDRFTSGRYGVAFQT
jgi:IS605 OrfB family transposase